MSSPICQTMSKEDCDNFWKKMTEKCETEREERSNDALGLGRWITLKGLIQASELNGLIGEVFTHVTRKTNGRVGVRVYNNTMKSLMRVISVKPENTESFLVEECVQAVRLQADGEKFQPRKMLAQLIPKIVLEKKYATVAQNCPVPFLCGIPLQMAKVEPYNALKERAEYDNQWATWFIVNATSGFAPMEWQSWVGPTVLYREDHLPLSTGDITLLNDYMSMLLDKYADSAINPNYHLTPKGFRKFRDCRVQATNDPDYPYEKYHQLNI